MYVDKRLDEDFEKLRERLIDPDTLNPAGSAPIFYFVYRPAHILTVRKLLPGWIGRLRNENNLKTEVVSLAELMWEVIDASGRWEMWLELEDSFDPEQANEAVRDVLRSDNAFVKRVAQEVAPPRKDTILFFIDVGLLHPYFRTRLIENYLKNKVEMPVVFFYPGRRAGEHGLHFLEFYPEDPGYRSTIKGGSA